MERKIGDIFTFNGKYLVVIEGFCEDCYFHNKSCCTEHSVMDIIGECYADFRNDNKGVCFKLIEE